MDHLVFYCVTVDLGVLLARIDLHVCLVPQFLKYVHIIIGKYEIKVNITSKFQTVAVFSEFSDLL